MDGVLVIDKPEGPTSHDVVAAVRRLLPRGTKVGHTGTLDPLATGVLPLVLGKATRLARFLSADRKQYLATIAFGTSTSTYDRMGETTATGDAGALAGITAAAIDTALDAFVGPQLQVPPAHSAKKVEGHRAYDLARAGAEVTLEPVAVTAFALRCVSWDDESHQAVVEVACSAGYYVRSLAHDLGRALGVPAHLAALRRTASGSFTLTDAHPLGAVVEAAADTRATWVIPPGRLLPSLPACVLTEAQVQAVCRGMAIRPDESQPAVPLLRLLDGDGLLVALAVPAEMPGHWQPRIVLGG